MKAVRVFLDRVVLGGKGRRGGEISCSVDMSEFYGVLGRIRVLVLVFFLGRL